MNRYIEDADGDHIQVHAEDDGVTKGVTFAVTQRDTFEGETTVHHATVGPIDPHKLIEGIHAEMGWDRPSTASESGDDRINSGETALSFEEAIGRRSSGAEDAAIESVVEEEPERVSGAYVHITPATAENPRVWAGADEPIIDSLIGRVADLEDEKERTEAHGHLTEHWNRRLDVVATALGMLPAPRRQGGLAAAFAGEATPDPHRVKNALKIARFAADEDREIPGVDR